MSELTQQEFDRARDRFIGMMVGPDPAKVWREYAYKLAARCDRLEADLARLIDAAKTVVHEADSTVITDAAGQRHQKVFVKNLAALADAYQQSASSNKD